MISKEDLIELYEKQQLPMHEVAERLGVSVGSVYNYAKKYNIKSRPPMTDDVKKRLSEKMKGRPSPNRGRKLSAETKRKISESRKRQYANKTRFGGHRKRRKDGYICVYCPDHAFATKDGYVMEHILVMEEHIKRHLNADEVVHHKNKIRDDNRIENLELMTFKEHCSLHMKERWAKRRNNNG